MVPLRIGGGTRIKIFEAMGMGMPVVSTAVGAEGLPVQHGEKWCLPTIQPPLPRRPCSSYRMARCGDAWDSERPASRAEPLQLGGGHGHPRLCGRRSSPQDAGERLTRHSAGQAVNCLNPTG